MGWLGRVTQSGPMDNSGVNCRPYSTLTSVDRRDSGMKRERRAEEERIAR